MKQNDGMIDCHAAWRQLDMMRQTWGFYFPPELRERYIRIATRYEMQDQTQWLATLKAKLPQITEAIAELGRWSDNANCPLLVMGTAENTPSRNVRNLRVADLEIDGNRAHQQAECWDVRGEGSEIRNNGITARGVSDSAVERVRCHDCRSGGLVTEKGVVRLTVSDFASWDNQYDGLAAYVTEDSLFTRLMLHDNPGAGISLDHRVAHCVISDAVLARNGGGIFMRNARDNLFNGITIRDSVEHGVFLSQAAVSNLVVREARTIVEWIPTPNTECTGNVFAGLQVTDSGGIGFLANTDTCVGNVIMGARFARNRGGGFRESRPGLVKAAAALQEE